MLKNRRDGAFTLWMAIVAVGTASLLPCSFAQQSKTSIASAHAVAAAARAGDGALGAGGGDQLAAPAVPAHVNLVNGMLTVNAGNSDLGQILAEISRLTGMSVSGLNGGPRVFGVYGPADPRSVVTSLLMGSGYNFLLVGGGGMPRALVLTPETKAPPTVAKAPKPEPPDEYEQQYAEQDSTDPYMR